MENLVLQRLSFSAAMLIGMLVCFFAYRNIEYPLNYGIIAVIAAAVIGYGFFVSRQEKDARHSAVSAVAAQFGRLISFDGSAVSFERGGTIFNAEFPTGKYNNTFKVYFSIPKVFEKFVIQHREILMKSLPGCEPVQSSPLPEGVSLCSQNPEILLNFLKNQRILGEIQNYPAGFMRRFLIVFDGGRFELEWVPRASEQINGFYKVCQTAVVFHDELRKLAKLN